MNVIDDNPPPRVPPTALHSSEGRFVPFPLEPSVVNPLWADYKYSFALPYGVP